MRAYLRLRIRGTATAKNVGKTIDAIARASEIPGPGDIDAIIPPTQHAYVRRVPGCALWIWYQASDTDLWLLSLTNVPPS
jgi:hypothetical protein